MLVAVANVYKYSKFEYYFMDCGKLSYMINQKSGDISEKDGFCNFEALINVAQEAL